MDMKSAEPTLSATSGFKGERVIKAYETEGHGIYWQVFEWESGDTKHLGDLETLEDVMKLSRERKLPLTLYTQEWAETFEKEEASK
jgi:hypothetical protein